MRGLYPRAPNPENVAIMDREALLRSIDETVRFSFSRSSGAGGQNVNKVSTKVSARVALSDLAGLTEEEQRRAVNRLGSRITTEGELIVHASEHRSQRHNRTAAMERLRRLLLGACRT